MFKKHIHLWLFIATVITTTIAGAEWIFGKSFYFHHESMGWEQFKEGFWFSVPFLAFLTSHEFGHYFMAKYKKINVSLPFYIPAYFVIFTSIGTFGAFIKIKDYIASKKDYFDIGIAGPLAGFVVAVFVLSFGFYNLPSDEFIFKIHPEYRQLGGNYRLYLDSAKNLGEAIVLGKSLIFQFLENVFADPSKMPHPFELTHYPLIVAGFLGLLFTSINLIPIGQLDGGHILYALIGKKAFDIVSPVFLVLFVSYSGLGVFRITDFGINNNEEIKMNLLKFLMFIYFNYLCFSKIFTNKINNWVIALSVILLQLIITNFWPQINGYSGFLAFGFLIGRLLGVYHPETIDIEPIGLTRKILGWMTLIIFILCFSPNPIN